MNDPTKETEHRDQLIEGLRALADFIQQHPEFPVPYLPAINHVAGGDDEAGIREIHIIAEALGVDVTRSPGGHFVVRTAFAGLSYRAAFVPLSSMDDFNAEQKHLEEWNTAGRPPVAELADHGHLEDAAAVDEGRCPSCGEPSRLIASGAVGHCGDEHGNDCPGQTPEAYAEESIADALELADSGRELVDGDRIYDDREEYAQAELDQDRNPTEAGFQEWKARRAAVGAS